LPRATVEIRSSIGGTLDQVQEQQFRLLRKLQINSQKELIDAATRLARQPFEVGPASPLVRHGLPQGFHAAISFVLTEA
jgi:hypothetical protein